MQRTTVDAAREINRLMDELLTEIEENEPSTEQNLKVKYDLEDIKNGMEDLLTYM